jgi:hypothetical protein
MTFDDLRFYGSGASSDGGAQTSPGANLGHYRSSTELSPLAIFGAMENIYVQRVSEVNAPGVGMIESDGAGNLRWTAPGESAGAWTAVADGSTVVLPCGDKGLRVHRSGSTPPAAQRSLKLLDVFNGELGCANVSDADRATGLDVYRCVFAKNVSGDDMLLWLEPQTTNLSVGVEAPSAQPGGYVQTIADETTVPVGITFFGAELVAVAAGEIVGIWLRRRTGADADASARELVSLRVDVLL